MTKIRRSILIAHENAEMRDLFIQLLGHEDFELYAASDGAQALEIIESKRVELVFIDQYMPVIDGYDILIKAKSINPLVKIILLIGAGGRHAKAKALKEGAFGTITKPFQLGGILRWVEKALDMTLISRPASPFEEEDERTIFEKAFSYKLLAMDKRKRIIASVVSIVSSILIVCALVGFIYSRRDRMYMTPYEHPTALAWTGEALWVSDWVTQSYYEHKEIRDFTVNSVYYLQGSHPTGLAWDGKTLWSCNAWEKKIFKHRMDKAFSVVEEYPSPGPYPTGLYFDGIYLWICDSKKSMIYKTIIESGKLTVLKQYHSPGTEPVGMFADGMHFWTADAGTGLIYKHAYDDQLTVKERYKLSQYDSGRDRSTGMTWNGTYIWTCSEGTRRLYRHYFHNLEPQKL